MEIKYSETMARLFTRKRNVKTIHSSCNNFRAVTSTLIILFLSTITNTTSGSASDLTSINEWPQQARASSPVDESRNQTSSINIFLQLENELLMWVKAVGKRGHTVFDKAENQITPLAAIYVDSRRGFGHFTTLQAAIDHVPMNNLRRVHIIVAPGIYKEKILVPSTKPYITIIGGGWNNTILQWSDTASTIGQNGEKLGTYLSTSVAVEAHYFIARNITFKNAAPVAAAGAVGEQAVALRITGDTAAFYGCRFVSGQDTLYDHEGRHYFKDCYIEGSIDFIFGDGLSLYESCHLHAIPQTTFGSVAAHKRAAVSEDTGFSFLSCRITGSGLLYLGRAWGSYARVVYSYTYMDTIIAPEGWSNWNDPKRNQTVVFGQYKCYGPGAKRTGRVPWSRELTEIEARPFLSLSFVEGDEWVKP